MGRYIIKAARDQDLYMEWSSGVDAPLFIGTRVQILRHLLRSTPCASAEARVARADRTGTSALRDPHSPNRAYPLEGAWDDPGLIVEQRGWLPRDRFAEFLTAYTVSPKSAYRLLDPFND